MANMSDNNKQHSDHLAAPQSPSATAAAAAMAAAMHAAAQAAAAHGTTTTITSTPSTATTTTTTTGTPLSAVSNGNIVVQANGNSNGEPITTNSTTNSTTTATTNPSSYSALHTPQQSSSSSAQQQQLQHPAPSPQQQQQQQQQQQPDGDDDEDGEVNESVLMAANNNNNNSLSNSPDGHILAIGQMYANIEDLKAAVREHAANHGFYVNISCEMASAGRTPRVRARCNRAGKPPALSTCTPESKKRRRTTLKVGCSWELVAHLMKDSEDGSGCWKITSFSPDHCELCRPSQAQLELMGKHKKRYKIAPAPRAIGPEMPSPSGSGGAVGAGAGVGGGGGGGMVGNNMGGGSGGGTNAASSPGTMPSTPTHAGVAVGSMGMGSIGGPTPVGSVASLGGGGGGVGGSAHVNGTSVPATPHSASMMAVAESPVPDGDVVEGHASVDTEPPPRRRRRIMIQDFTDVANLACLQEAHTDLVRRLLAGLLGTLRDADERITTLSDLCTSITNFSDTPMPNSIARAASRKCGFCGNNTHTARSCQVKKSFGTQLTAQDLEYSPLPPIFTGVVDVPLIDFIPSPITVVQLRSTVPPHDPSMHPNFIAALYTSEDVQLRHMDIPLRMVTWAALLHWSNGFNSPSYCVFVLPTGGSAQSQGGMMGSTGVTNDDENVVSGPIVAPEGPQPHNTASTSNGALVSDAAVVAAALAAAAAGGAGAGVGVDGSGTVASNVHEGTVQMAHHHA